MISNIKHKCIWLSGPHADVRKKYSRNLTRSKTFKKYPKMKILANKIEAFYSTRPY